MNILNWTFKEKEGREGERERGRKQRRKQRRNWVQSHTAPIHRGGAHSRHTPWHPQALGKRIRSHFPARASSLVEAAS